MMFPGCKREPSATTMANIAISPLRSNIRAEHRVRFFHFRELVSFCLQNVHCVLIYEKI